MPSMICPVFSWITLFEKWLMGVGEPVFIFNHRKPIGLMDLLSKKIFELFNGLCLKIFKFISSLSLKFCFVEAIRFSE